jgi:hypothetical protein
MSKSNGCATRKYPDSRREERHLAENGYLVGNFTQFEAPWGHFEEWPLQ